MRICVMWDDKEATVVYPFLVETESEELISMMKAAHNGYIINEDAAGNAAKTLSTFLWASIHIPGNGVSLHEDEPIENVDLVILAGN